MKTVNAPVTLFAGYFYSQLALLRYLYVHGGIVCALWLSIRRTRGKGATEEGAADTLATFGPEWKITPSSRPLSSANMLDIPIVAVISQATTFFF